MIGKVATKEAKLKICPNFVRNLSPLLYVLSILLCFMMLIVTSSRVEAKNLSNNQAQLRKNLPNLEGAISPALSAGFDFQIEKARTSPKTSFFPKNKNILVTLLDTNEARENQKLIVLTLYASTHRLSYPLLYPKEIMNSDFLIFENKKAISLRQNYLDKKNPKKKKHHNNMSAQVQTKHHTQINEMDLNDKTVFKQLPQAIYDMHQMQERSLPKVDSIFTRLELLLNTQDASHPIVLPKEMLILVPKLSEIEHILSKDKLTERFTHNQLGLDSILIEPFHIYFSDWSKAGLGDPLMDLASLMNNLQMNETSSRAFFDVYAKKWGWRGGIAEQKQAQVSILRQLHIFEHYLLTNEPRYLKDYHQGLSSFYEALEYLSRSAAEL